MRKKSSALVRGRVLVPRDKVGIGVNTSVPGGRLEQDVQYMPCGDTPTVHLCPTNELHRTFGGVCFVSVGHVF